MLVNENGDFHGMLSGGCLEGDLAERSRKIIETNRKQAKIKWTFNDGLYAPYGHVDEKGKWITYK